MKRKQFREQQKFKSEKKCVMKLLNEDGQKEGECIYEVERNADIREKVLECRRKREAAAWALEKKAKAMFLKWEHGQDDWQASVCNKSSIQ